jgi:hypothetical protein
MHAPRKLCIVQRIKREGFVPRCSVLRELRNVGGVSLRNGRGGGDARSALVLARDLALPPILSLLLLLLRLRSRMKWTLRTQQPEDSSKVTRSATEFCAVPYHTNSKVETFSLFQVWHCPVSNPSQDGVEKVLQYARIFPHHSQSDVHPFSGNAKGKTGYLLKNQELSRAAIRRPAGLLGLKQAPAFQNGHRSVSPGIQGRGASGRKPYV